MLSVQRHVCVKMSLNRVVRDASRKMTPGCTSQIFLIVAHNQNMFIVRFTIEHVRMCSHLFSLVRFEKMLVHFLFDTCSISELLSVFDIQAATLVSRQIPNCLELNSDTI